jgi:hypothetical protein
MMLSETSYMFQVNFLIMRDCLNFLFLSSIFKLYNAYANCLGMILSYKLFIVLCVLKCCAAFHFVHSASFPKILKLLLNVEH